MTDPMLQHRRAQTDAHEYTDHPLSSIVSVELNVMDGCNRSCSFCPHNDPVSYPNHYDWKMDSFTVAKLAQDLASFNYKGRISTTGYGEPLLHKGLEDLVSIMRRWLPQVIIETNTNSDPLTVERIRSLYNAGMTYIYANAYDGPHQVPPLIEKFDQAGIDPSRYRIRNRWPGPDDHLDMRLNNRGGSLIAKEHGHEPLKEPLKQQCAYPFFKAFIDYNGDLIYCSNSWKREIIVGNIHEDSLPKLWLSEEMEQLRWRLYNKDRDFASCATCDVNGMLHSTESIDVLARHYGWHDGNL